MHCEPNMLKAARLLATVCLLALSGCAATASYPGGWSPVVKTDDCRAITGRYGNQAAEVFPLEANPPSLTTVFSAVQRGTLSSFSSARGEPPPGTAGVSTLANVASVDLRVEPATLTATFATIEGQTLQLVFKRLHQGPYPLLDATAAAVAAPSKATDFSYTDLYICPGGLSGLITFLAQAAGTPSSATKMPAESRIALFKASDGSLIVRWAMASTHLGGYDSEVWLRYPLILD